MRRVYLPSPAISVVTASLMALSCYVLLRLSWLAMERWCVACDRV